MEYLWLSIYVKMDYLTYINLLRIFRDIKEIYLATNDKDKFLKFLRSNGIRINYTLYSNLVDSNLKLKSLQLFQSLKKRNIKIITINSVYYPKKLVNVFEPPLALFAYGNLSLLKAKKVYVHDSCNFSSEGRRVYTEYCEYMKQSGIAIVSDILTEYSDVIYLPYLKKIDKSNILVISHSLEETLNINYEYITGICDCLFIPEASHNIKIGMVVDLILEQGKDILVVPSSIYNKEAYFSNYLLRDGALCITSKTDLLQYFK